MGLSRDASSAALHASPAADRQHASPAADRRIAATIATSEAERAHTSLALPRNSSPLNPRHGSPSLMRNDSPSRGGGWRGGSSGGGVGAPTAYAALLDNNVSDGDGDGDGEDFAMGASAHRAAARGGVSGHGGNGGGGGGGNGGGRSASHNSGGRGGSSGSGGFVHMRNLRNASSESGGGGRDAFPAARGARRTLHPEYERGTPQPHPAPASSVADRTLRSQPDTVGERLAVLRAGCEAPAPRPPRAPSTSAAEIALLPDFSDSLPADYRKGYGEWRSGNARGARGEPDTQPPPPVDVELERRAGDGPRRASTPPPTRCPHSNGHAMAGSVYIHTEVTSGVRGGIASPPGSPVGQLPVFTAAGERVADGRPRAADVLPRRSRSHSSDDSHASHAVTRAMRTIMPRLARIASGHRLAASDSSLPSYLAATSPYALRGSWPLRLVGRVKVSVFGASSSSLEVLSTSAIELSRADLVRPPAPSYLPWWHRPPLPTSLGPRGRYSMVAAGCGQPVSSRG